MLIEPVTEANLSAAAHVHAESWRASHADVCSPAFLAAHDDQRQAAYIREGMQRGKRFYLLTEETPAGVVAVEGNTISDLYLRRDFADSGVTFPLKNNLYEIEMIYTQKRD